MSWFSSFGFGRRRGELQEEIDGHVRMAIAERVDRGETEEEARQAAIREFGNVPLIKDVTCETWGWTSLEQLAQDFHYALRQIRRSPMFAATVVGTLGLGIGAPVAMFTISYGVLLQPLPFPEEQQLYQPVQFDAKDDENISTSYDEIQQWRASTHETAEIAFTSQGLGILDAPSGALLISKVETSPNLFSLLRTQPILGRGFLPAEQENSNAHVVLISNALWRQEFSTDPAVVGKTVHLSGVPYSVIGVMPAQFEYPVWDNRPEVWTPLERSPQTLARANDPYAGYDPILRVKKDSPKAVVEAQLLSAQLHIAQSAKPGEMVATRVRLMNLRDSLVSGVRPALTALEIAVALVWSIACFNVAGLFMARIAERRTEIAVRGALGAGRLRILCQFLTESLSLSCAGAAVGLALAELMLQLFRHMLQKTLPLSQNIHLNWAVWTILIAFTFTTGLVFGILPATVAARSPLEQGLKNGGRNSSADRTQKSVSRLLLVGEIALSVALLVGAGLMMRTMYALRHVGLGFRADHIVLTSLTVPSYAYKGQDLNSTAWEPLINSVQHLPGVQTAALSTVMPIGHAVELQTIVYSTEWTKGNVDAVVRAASPDLMHALGVPMRSGRFFTAQDTAGTIPVTVVNQTFVNRYLGGGNALGKQIKFGRVPSTATVVGVIEDIHQDSVEDPSRPELYVCLAQLRPENSLYVPLIGRVMELAVRTHTAPGAMIPELRHRIRQVNPNLAVGDFTTMTQAVQDSLDGQRLAAGVTGAFGGLALLITIIGLYGLLSYSVTQRTQEIGIRMAMGADRSSVIQMILRQALALLALGIIAGLAMAMWGTRLLHRFLYGVSQNDPWTLVFVTGVLLVFGLLATFFPAKRASTIDPVQALRAK
ncbi:ABC transporter permease [Edaphobacter aggregans]|uniref:ABC transporter permease n=1 Tax=Edaphobacter aggregans TaxID=570835 RepID=UPI00055438C9|nr:ABC transporter permease [Edaphobacter aggregans]